jgi:hypothetical protein
MPLKPTGVFSGILFEQNNLSGYFRQIPGKDEALQN